MKRNIFFLIIAFLLILFTSFFAKPKNKGKFMDGQWIQESKFHDLDLETSEQGFVLITPLSYVVDTKIILEAIPDKDWKFHHWGGNANGTDNPITVEITEGLNITATFNEKKTKEGMSNGY